MTDERKAKIREHERTIASGARLKTEEILTDANRVLFVREKLRDLAGRGSVHGDVDLAYRGETGSVDSYRLRISSKLGLHTLSVSMVATSSSASTDSPTFFSHDLSVPSEMDSAIWGTFTVSARDSR